LWNGEQDELMAATASQQIEANRLYGLGVQALSYDAGVISQYAQAVLAGDTKSQQFYRDVLMRPALLPFVDEWQAELEAGGRPNLLQDADYLAALEGPYQEAKATADEYAAEATEAGRVGDSYVLTTVLLAISLFFAGVTSSFRYPTMRIALLLGSVLGIALAAIRLIDLPLAEATRELIPWL
jgi:hypothetical protein